MYVLSLFFKSNLIPWNLSHFGPVYNFSPMQTSLMPKCRSKVTVTSIYSCKVKEVLSPKNLESWMEKQQLICLNASSLEGSFTTFHYWDLLNYISLYSPSDLVQYLFKFHGLSKLLPIYSFSWFKLVIISFNYLETNTSKIMHQLILDIVSYPAVWNQTERQPPFLFTVFL